VALGLTAEAQAQAVAPPGMTAQPLTPTDRETGTKSATSRLAETDPELLGRTDATPVEVVVKLDYDSVATYDGSLPGLDATSPAMTGQELSGTSVAEQQYEGYIAQQEATFEAELGQAVPEATVGEPLRTVYGGVRAVVPANRIDDVLRLDNVVAVQEDTLLQPLTDASPGFIGASNLYGQTGGASNAGSGVIVGVLDSGVWPEHPSFADQGNLAPPPAKFDGTPRTCDFGDNPLTPAVDPFVCNNKLIGGQAFLAAYLSSPARAAAEPYTTARDSDGHGTHTTSTSAGNVVDSAPVLGVERGPINGIAPGAWVSAYKVCGIQGCFSSDSATAVGQAILDGVDVINFSISGGTNPATDPVELAFLDAYAAGVFVAASAGNSGPGAGTADHLSPWVTTVAASTQTREFRSTLTLAGSDGATAALTGASITAGVDSPLPIVLASAPPYSNALCNAPAPAGTFTGVIVACQRGGNARVEKGYNVVQGGAAGMVLYNPALADIETDNHWLPAVHLADGAELLAFLAAHPDVTATFTAGEKADGQGDVMAAFSSRGPGGLFVKPDVTAPGVQVLAGHTPTPQSVAEGPPGEYFQAIAGTSMSSPQVAGSAALLASLHPDWTPGQIKSALMTTATTSVVKEDLTTPADPFDLGSGRVVVDAASNPGLTFDASAADMYDFGNDALNSVHLNTPAINAPVMPGRLTTTRTATNVTGTRVRYDVSATAPAGSSISVTPRRIDLRAGQSADIEITIESNAPTAQYFGEVRLTPRNGRGLPTLHLPVAFVPQQGTVSLLSNCSPSEVLRNQEAACTVTAQNNGFAPTSVDLATTVNRNLKIDGADGATLGRGRAELKGVTLSGAAPGTPTIAAGATPAGFLPLSLFGIAPVPVGDEDIVSFNVPPFVYAGKTYGKVGIDSNGYIVVGGGTSEDNECCNPVIPSPARPNNVLAPFWTDLDGTGAPGIRVTTLTDGTSTWLVVEWDVNVFGTTSNRHFQVWIGVNGTEDISFAYDPAALPADPAGQPVVVGAENEDGSAGATIAGLPTEDLRVASTDPVPGGAATYTVFVEGRQTGEGVVTSEMTTALVAGTTVVQSKVTVKRR
jgi:subtilisin family serine protease